MQHRPLIFIAVWTAVAACNTTLGLDERPSRQTTASGGGSTASGTCGDPCFDPPAGWSGPTAVARGDDAPACAGDTPNVELVLFEELTADPALCDCACGPAEGVDCTATAFTISLFDQDDCIELEETPVSVVGQCVGNFGGINSAHYTDAAPDVSAASCVPIDSGATLPMPVWGRHLVGCGPVEPEQGAPVDSEICIYQAGDHACPEGPYAEKSVWFAQIEDTRACAACTCGPVDVADCNEVVKGYSEANCQGNPDDIPLEPMCVNAPVDFTTVIVESVAPTGSCAPSAEATGDAVPADPTTVCCIP